MLRLGIMGALLVTAAGCIVYEDNPDTVYVVDDNDAPVVVYNAAPYVFDAYSGCYFDRGYRDDIWFFDAWVDDPDGALDVVQVWADVYDDWTGQLIESFELYPTQNPQQWYSDWLVSSTWLDCWYDGYSVDIVAYDSFEAWGASTIWPSTYAW